MTKKPLFSQRKGLKPIPGPQTESWDNPTVIAVWDAMSGIIIEARHTSVALKSFVTASLKSINLELLHRPADNYYDVYHLASYHHIGMYGEDSLATVLLESPYRKWYFAAPYNERFDFIELFARGDGTPAPCAAVSGVLNKVFEERQVAYRLINGQMTDIVNEEERKAVEEAGQKSEHIVNAARFLYDKDALDYKNSVKESILAVEEISKGITGKSGATLGQCLRALEKELPARHLLWKGMEKLYAYSNKVGGVRHAQKPGEADGEENEVSPAEARFILVTCSTICNYLRAKQAK